MRKTMLFISVILLGAGMSLAQNPTNTQMQTEPAKPDRQKADVQTGAAAQAGGANSVQDAAQAANAPAASGTITIPAGTTISIRTDQSIVADKSKVGTTYPAELAHDVSDASGNTVIPINSPATIAVVNNNKSMLGTQQLGLALKDVTLNGHQYAVQSATASETSNGGIGMNKRTGEYVGGGALLGTLIGAVAGHGKGAAIGAAAGAAGGAITQVLTGGNNINIPAESTLTFKLDQPLTLNP
jgi:hypothetical protein